MREKISRSPDENGMPEAGEKRGFAGEIQEPTILCPLGFVLAVAPTGAPASLAGAQRRDYG